MFGIGFQELVVILLIVLIIFGSSRLPQLGKGLGEGIRNFKRGLKGDERPERIEEGKQTHNDSSG
jgi:sec-independent protein translocase protein TatA